jgi:hypothetical protein
MTISVPCNGRVRDEPQLRFLKRIVPVALVLLGLAIAGSAQADMWSWATGPSMRHEEGKRDWGVEVVPYLWVAGLDGELGFKDAGTIGVEASFSDLASNLDTGIAGLMDFRYRRWHVLVDGSWVRLTKTVTPDARPVIESVTLTPSVAFGTAGVSYELPLDWPMSIETYLAARWWHITADATLVTAGPTASFGITEVWADAIVGARISYAITDKWRVRLVGDVGGGSADLDWQAMASVSWMFHRNIGVTLAYRILGVDYSSSTLIYDIRQSGFLLGFNFAY